MHIISADNRWCDSLYGFWNLLLVLFFSGMGASFGHSFLTSQVKNMWPEGWLALGLISCAVLQIFCFYRNLTACILLTVPHAVIVFFLLWATVKAVGEKHIIDAALLCLWALIQTISHFTALKKCIIYNRTK